MFIKNHDSAVNIYFFIPLRKLNRNVVFNFQVSGKIRIVVCNFNYKRIFKNIVKIVISNSHDQKCDSTAKSFFNN